MVVFNCSSSKKSVIIELSLRDSFSKIVYIFILLINLTKKDTFQIGKCLSK
ncbi:hypothetical protein D930_00887 [Enterococcus faecalis KI-6-1-110608-1]|nr:hypothetical protein D930_00887 [Enterococcus faecalis KI-6-1-110608-1]